MWRFRVELILASGAYLYHIHLMASSAYLSLHIHSQHWYFLHVMGFVRAYYFVDFALDYFTSLFRPDWPFILSVLIGASFVAGFQNFSAINEPASCVSPLYWSLRSCLAPHYSCRFTGTILIFTCREYAHQFHNTHPISYQSVNGELFQHPLLLLRRDYFFVLEKGMLHFFVPIKVFVVNSKFYCSSQIFLPPGFTVIIGYLFLTNLSAYLIKY